VPSLLLTVEDRFTVSGRGVGLGPWVDVTSFELLGRIVVELRKPDGSRATVEAFADIPRTNPLPTVYKACVLLVGLTKEDVPVGTEVWSTE
jgi:hypothetical protein